MVRAAPPGVGSASSTWTSIPASARTMAAASPLGPAPMMHALRFITYHLERPAQVGMLARSGKNYFRGPTAGHSVTTMFPLGSRSRVGAYSPNNCRRHQIPVARFCAMLVNQYCQSTARTCRGGSRGKGLPAKRVNTSWSPEQSLSSVFGTIGYSRQEPRDANHKFQSNRG